MAASHLEVLQVASAYVQKHRGLELGALVVGGANLRPSRGALGLVAWRYLVDRYT